MDFSNTEVAFKAKSTWELRYSYLLFKAMGYNWLVQLGPKLVDIGFKIGLPIKGLIKRTVFKQFCGGENIDDCEKTIDHMDNFGIGTILDYSVEGEEKEQVFEATADEIIKTIIKAANNSKIPFSVFKTTGLARMDLLEKVNSKVLLNSEELLDIEKIKTRVDRVCKAAYDHHVRIFIDAEESWIQDPIDLIAEQMMEKYNTEKVIVYNTLQFYRHDRLAALKESVRLAREKGYFYGVKLVRGAYMEKESARAKEMGYLDPIQPSKEATDIDFNEGLKFCIENIDKVAFCAGTHNEDSCKFLTDLMIEHKISPNDERVYFSQLFGMSDNLSYNLSGSGFKVTKYLPYGPVKAVLPYLFRRAQENTSVKGQAGRELTLIEKELDRRQNYPVKV